MNAEDVGVGNYVIGHYSQQDGPIHMNSPNEMSPTEWARHKVTHLPYHCSCPHCVAGKKPNLHHRRSGPCRRLPHVDADYGYLRDSAADTTIAALDQSTPGMQNQHESRRAERPMVQILLSCCASRPRRQCWHRWRSWRQIRSLGTPGDAASCPHRLLYPYSILEWCFRISLSSL